MPTEPAVPPSPQTPPAAPAVPPVAPAPEPLKSLTNDPLMRAVFRDLRSDPKVVPAIEPAPVVPPAAPAPAAPVTPPPAAPVPAPGPVPPVVKKKARIKVVEDNIPLPQSPAPVVQPPPAPPAATTDDEGYIQGLTPEQRDELREAEVAERLFPDRHKGLKKRMVDFYKAFDTDCERLIQENPSIQLNESNEDFQRLVAKKPKLGGSEFRKVQREIGAEEAVERTKREFAPRLSELERDTKANSLRPQVEGVQSNIKNGVGKKLILNDEKSPLREAIEALESDPVKAKQDYSLEIEIFNGEVEHAAKLAGEYLYLVNGATTPDFNPVKIGGVITDSPHKQLSDLINSQCDKIAGAGPEYTIRNGKRFMTRVQFTNMLNSNPAEASSLDPATFETTSYWTLSHPQVLEMLSHNAKSSAEARVKYADESAKKHGYERKRGKNIAQAQPAPAGIPAAPASITPPSRPSAMPGAVAPVAPSAPTAGSMSSRLGLRAGS